MELDNGGYIAGRFWIIILDLLLDTSGVGELVKNQLVLA
jgi:hypothetical protein